MFGWIGVIIGILLLLFAAFMIFFFPMSTAEASGHQTQGWNGVLFGFVAGIIGVALIFLP
jgi:ABC-type Mn2+/Zn2+ transport system permease subunit